MRKEAQRIEDWARDWQVAYRDDANRWSHISVGLGILTAGAGAIAGASGLADKMGAFTVSLVALAAALLNVIGSSSRPAAKSSVSSASATANTILCERARLFHLTKVDFDPMNTVLDEFTKLCELREATVMAAPMRRAPGRSGELGKDKPTSDDVGGGKDKDKDKDKIVSAGRGNLDSRA